MPLEHSDSLCSNLTWPGEVSRESHTCAVFVHHRHCFPVVVKDQIQDRPADSCIIWVQVDVKQVFVVHRRVFPAGLYMWNFESIANRLHGTDRGTVGRAKESSHTKSQLVTGWWPQTRRGRKGRQGKGQRKRELWISSFPWSLFLFSLLEIFLYSPSVCWENMLNPTSNILEIVKCLRDLNVGLMSNTSQGQFCAIKNEWLVSHHYF